MSGQLVPFLNLTTMKGDAAMETAKMKKPEWVDYAVAYPFLIPLWVAAFAWLVQVFSVGWFWLVPICAVSLWLSSYLDSAPRLFAYYAAQEAHPAPAPLLAEVKP